MRLPTVPNEIKFRKEFSSIYHVKITKLKKVNLNKIVDGLPDFD